MNPTVIRHLATALLLGFLATAAAAFENGPIDAHVTDAASHEPVTGAFVVATWQRENGSIAATSLSCVHLQVTHSDARGRYHIDKWSRPFNPLGWLTGGSSTMVVQAYRAGMIYAVPPAVSFDERNGDIQLVKFSGSQSQHMDYLWHVAAWHCGDLGDDAPSLQALRRAVYSEAREIATDSERDQKTLAAIWRQIEQGQGPIVSAPR